AAFGPAVTDTVLLTVEGAGRFEGGTKMLPLPPPQLVRSVIPNASVGTRIAVQRAGILVLRVMHCLQAKIARHQARHEGVSVEAPHMTSADEHQIGRSHY